MYYQADSHPDSVGDGIPDDLEYRDHGNRNAGNCLDGGEHHLL